MDKWERAFRDLVSKGFYRSRAQPHHPIHWSWEEGYPVQDPDFGFEKETIDLMATVLTGDPAP